KMYPHVTLAEVASKATNDYLKRKGVGKATIAQIRAVLREVGLRFSNDPDDLWPSDRGSLTALFLKKGPADFEKAVQALCDSLSTHKLVRVATELGWNIYEETTDGEGQDDQGGQAG